MQKNKFLKAGLIAIIPAILVTLVGIIIFKNPKGFFIRSAMEYYLYSFAISAFVINSRFGSINLGIIPAIVVAVITTLILKTNPQYSMVPLPMLILPLLILFTGLNYITGMFFKTIGNHPAKALLYGITAALFRTFMFFAIQFSFKNIEMFNFLYFLQQGLLLFLPIGVGISIADMIPIAGKKEEVDIVQKVINEMNEDE
ncbi:MAG: hypothetical protein JXR56_08805 [Candidatus Cloacimonetes bacterium]|nr:hypothetical protein [Candidatus Cloacimonadota bacterium]